VLGNREVTYADRIYSKDDVFRLKYNLELPVIENYELNYCRTTGIEEWLS